MAHLGPHLYSEDSEAIVEPASDVFEIDDFTSPSDWEKVGTYMSQHYKIIVLEEKIFTPAVVTYLNKILSMPLIHSSLLQD